MARCYRKYEKGTFWPSSQYCFFVYFQFVGEPVPLCFFVVVLFLFCVVFFSCFYTTLIIYSFILIADLYDFVLLKPLN